MGLCITVLGSLPCCRPYQNLAKTKSIFTALAVCCVWLQGELWSLYFSIRGEMPLGHMNHSLFFVCFETKYWMTGCYCQLLKNLREPVRVCMFTPRIITITSWWMIKPFTANQNPLSYWASEFKVAENNCSTCL